MSPYPFLSCNLVVVSYQLIHINGVAVEQVVESQEPGCSIPCFHGCEVKVVALFQELSDLHYSFFSRSWKSNG